MLNLAIKKFTAKGFQNDLTLFQSKTFQNVLSKNFHSIVKLSSDTQKKWFDTQKHFETTEILLKIEKESNPSSYPNQTCFQLCKSWNGQATSIDKLRQILKGKPGKSKIN